MADQVPRFAFDWRPGEHAEIVALLVRQQFGEGIGRVAKWAAWTVVTVAVLTVVATVLVGDRQSFLQLAPLTVCVMALLLVLPGLVGRTRAFVVRRTDPNVGHPFTFEFRETGLRILLQTVDSELRWEGMYRVWETDDMFLFYYNSRAAYFLPKRAIGHDSALDEVRDWIRQHVPPHVPCVLAS